ncbi:MAG: DUF4349 domain-containing protein [Eubacterium sp.]|jgi:hypothetical protein|nr:DUF4349 domain-containing protein [Eubacterium sp.]
MKKSNLIFMATSMLLIFSACAMEAPAARAADNGLAQAEFIASDESSEQLGYGGAAIASGHRTDISQPVTPDIPSENIRKIIRDASLEIETKDANDLYLSLVSYCKGLGGHEFSSETQNLDDYSVINATLKVPPESLDTFIAYAGENGNIVNLKTNSKDVTDEYYDTRTRLETKRKSLEQYYKLLANADNVDEILAIQITIDKIIEEIEAAEGRVRLLDSLVDMATVNLYIRQENDTVKINKDIDWNALSFEDMRYFIRNGFAAVINSIVSVIQWIIVAVAVSSPVWALAGIVLLIVFKIIKRNRVKKADKASKHPQPVEEENKNK